MKTLPRLTTPWRFAALAALLSAVVTAAYLPLRHNDFVNFDDETLILENPALHDLSIENLGDIFTRQLFTPHYKPLVYLSWAAELRAFGPDPRAFHRHNLTLHLLNTLLVLGLAAGLAPGAGRGWPRLAAAAALAAIWALHPMKVESVAWASERKDLLFAVFYLASMVAYLRWVDAGRRRWLALSAGLFLGAVLSKGTAITLPIGLLLIDLARRRRWRRKLVIEKLPHLAVAGLALLLYGLLPGPGEAGASVELLAGHGPMVRLTAAAHRHLAFASHWLAPVDLAVLYPVPAYLARPETARLVAYGLAHLAALAAVCLLIRRGSGRVAAAALFYSATLMPTLVAPISATNYLSDRYLYLPSLGLGALVVLAAAAIARRRPRLLPALAVGGAAGLVLLGVLSFRQVRVWRDSERLWDRVLQVHPPNPIAHNNRGAARRERGEHDGALADFEQAIALDPDYSIALANRGDLLRRLGRPAEGIADLDRAIALGPPWPSFWRLRGLARATLDDLPGAIADYGHAIELDPTDAEAFYLRAQTHRRLGDLATASADIDRALAHLRRPSAEAHLLRALILARTGDLAGGLAATTRALELEPDNAVALNNRGFLHLRLGDPAAALEDLERALTLRPRYPLALRSRGDALAALGRHHEACTAWREALAGGAPALASRLAACKGTGDPLPPAPATRP